MNIWLFIFYFTYSIVLLNKISGVDKKSQKSFDEIFGKGWEEKEKQLKELPQEQLNRHETTKRCQTDQNSRCFDTVINDASADQKIDRHENGDQCDDGRKIEIVRKFRAIKEKIKQKGIKYPTKDWKEFERIIAKKLGKNRTEIYGWKREFGMDRRNEFDVQQKEEIIHKFHAIKDQINAKYQGKGREQIERILAKKLGTNRTQIYKWKKELGMENQKIYNDYSNHSDQQKAEIVRQFYAIKQKIKERRIKFPGKEWSKIEGILAKKMGANRDYIYKWKKEFGMDRRRSREFDVQQKGEIIWKFRAIKEKIREKGRKYSTKEWNKIDRLIATKFGICRTHIYQWANELGMGRKTFAKKDKKKKSN